LDGENPAGSDYPENTELSSRQTRLWASFCWAVFGSTLHLKIAFPKGEIVRWNVATFDLWFIDGKQGNIREL